MKIRKLSLIQTAVIPVNLNIEMKYRFKMRTTYKKATIGSLFTEYCSLSQTSS